MDSLKKKKKREEGTELTRASNNFSSRWTEGLLQIRAVCEFVNIAQVKDCAHLGIYVRTSLPAASCLESPQVSVSFTDKSCINVPEHSVKLVANIARIQYLHALKKYREREGTRDIVLRGYSRPISMRYDPRYKISFGHLVTYCANVNIARGNIMKLRPLLYFATIRRSTFPLGRVKARKCICTTCSPSLPRYALIPPCHRAAR